MASFCSSVCLSCDFCSLEQRAELWIVVIEYLCQVEAIKQPASESGHSVVLWTVFNLSEMSQVGEKHAEAVIQHLPGMTYETRFTYYLKVRVETEPDLPSRRLSLPRGSVRTVGRVHKVFCTKLGFAHASS